jgi:ABC-type multidrug transport system ATPase subunit
MLKRLKAQGISILVSTPYMDEANLCDRIALIQNGKILEIDSPQNIINRFDKNLYAVKSKNMFQLLNDLRAYPKTESCFAFGDYHHLVLNEVHPDFNELKSYLQNHSELEINQIKPGIEDRFMQLMKAHPNPSLREGL